MLTSMGSLPTPEDIVATYGRLVSSLCRRMIREEETVRDAVQEVWLEVMKSLPSFRGEAKSDQTLPPKNYWETYL